MTIDIKNLNLREAYVEYAKFVADDERFYFIPGTTNKTEYLIISTYGRAYRQFNNGYIKEAKLIYKNGEYGYNLKLDNYIKFYSISDLMAITFFPKYKSAQLYQFKSKGYFIPKWNTKTYQSFFREWRIEDLHLILDSEQRTEAIKAKLENREPEYDDGLKAHQIINRFEPKRSINKYLENKFKTVFGRAYAPSIKAAKPQYKNATVSKEWAENHHIFKQFILDNSYYYPDGVLDVDKDIKSFGVGQTYGKRNVILVPHYINNVFKSNPHTVLGYGIRKSSAGYYIPSDSKDDGRRFDNYLDALAEGRRRKVRKIQEIVSKERKDGYIPENVLIAIEKWIPFTLDGKATIWEPSKETIARELAGDDSI